MRVVADSSGLIAAFKPTEREHRRAAAALESATDVIISPLTLGEIDHVVSREGSPRMADRFIDLIRQRVAQARATIAQVDAPILETALAVRRHYEALRLDLADAVNVALAAHYRTNVILTLDRRDFRAIRPLTGEPAFVLLPDDG